MIYVQLVLYPSASKFSQPPKRHFDVSGPKLYGIVEVFVLTLVPYLLGLFLLAAPHAARTTLTLLVGITFVAILTLFAGFGLRFLLGLLERLDQLF